MKPRNNSKKLNENGDGLIITEIIPNVNGIECVGISKWNDPEFVKKYQAEYRRKHKLKTKRYYNQYRKLNADKLKLYLHQYHKRNKSRIHKQKRQYYQEHKERIRRKNRRNRNLRNAYSKLYYKKNKFDIIQKTCIRFKKRYHSDPLFKVKALLRGRLGDVCKRKKLIKPKTMVLLGCDLVTFKTYMESRFEYGMTWDNHGKWGWHIDHIVPLDSAKTSSDLERLCHYKNLQPLWWYDNLSKNNK